MVSSGPQTHVLDPPSYGSYVFSNHHMVTLPVFLFCLLTWMHLWTKFDILINSRFDNSSMMLFLAASNSELAIWNAQTYFSTCILVPIMYMLSLAAICTYFWLEMTHIHNWPREDITKTNTLTRTLKSIPWQGDV